MNNPNALLLLLSTFFFLLMVAANYMENEKFSGFELKPL